MTYMRPLFPQNQRPEIMMEFKDTSFSEALVKAAQDHCDDMLFLAGFFVATMNYIVALKSTK